MDYRANVPHKRSAGNALTTTTGDPKRSIDAIERAYTLRMEAENYDPTHTDPAWATDALTHPHVDVMAFYRSVLGLPA